MLRRTATERPLSWPEDPNHPLACLRRSVPSVYRKGQIVYNEAQPASAVYLVTHGKVAVSRHTPDGRKVLVDIYRPDDFFGESAFVDALRRSEEAVAFEDARLMSWTAAEIEENILVDPRLGIALLRFAIERSAEFTRRVESLSVESIARRLARALIRFSQRLGIPEVGGWLRLPALTHDLLAQYVGTSREIVTQHMNLFRRQSLIRYSRNGVFVHGELLRAWLNGNESSDVSA